MRPTVTAGSSTSVLEVDACGEPLARGGRADHGADRLRGPAAAADDLPELARPHGDVIRRPAVVERLRHLNGVGIVDELTAEELDELLHVRPLPDPRSLQRRPRLRRPAPRRAPQTRARPAPRSRATLQPPGLPQEGPPAQTLRSVARPKPSGSRRPSPAPSSRASPSRDARASSLRRPPSGAPPRRRP